MMVALHPLTRIHCVPDIEKRQPHVDVNVCVNVPLTPIVSVQGKGVFVMDSVDGAVLDLVSCDIN